MSISLAKARPENTKLTARQQQILELIQNAIANTGAPPTRAEIAAELGFRSANAAEEHLQALARKGAIELVSGTSRGIRLRGRSTSFTGQSHPKQFMLPSQEFSQLVLPLVGRVAAGSPIQAQEHIEQTYKFDSNLFQQQPDYLLKVLGMSMKDIGILDGDLLAVKHAKDAKSGQIVVARIDDEVTVKRFRRSGDLIELIPENINFSIVRIKPGQVFEIEGLGVGVIRNSIFQ